MARVSRQVRRSQMKRELAQYKAMLKAYRPLMQAMQMIENAKEEGYQAGLAAGRSKSDAAQEGASHGKDTH